MSIQGGLEPLVGKLLAVPGAGPNVRDNDGLTPLHWASSQGLPKTGLLILLTLMPICPCMTCRRMELLQASLHGVTYPTGLQLPLLAGLESIVKQLLAAGAEVDAVTNDSWTALHESSLNGHTGVVRILLGAGAQARQSFL